MKAINRRKAFFSSICLLLGAFCGRLFASELLFCILTPIASVAVGVLLFFLFKKKVIFILLTVFFAVGTVASVIDCHVGYDGEINEEGERFVTGRVEEKRQYGFLLNDLTVDGKAFDGKLLVRIKENEYETGEELTLKGKVTNISHDEPFDTYGSSFYNDKIYYETNSFKIIDEKEGKLRFYEKVKLKIERAMRKNMPKENVGILKSLLFGDKSELVYTDKQMINGVGLAHIFAVSGLHVGFLVSLILFLLKKLRIPKTVGGWIAAVVVVFYGFLTGFPSGMKRVSVVLALQFLAYLKARKTDPPTTLALAGAIIVLFNPRELFDIGFVMSFVSVAGIVCYAPKLYDTLAKVWENRAFLYVAGTLSSTIAATLFIFPISVGVFSFLFTVYRPFQSRHFAHRGGTLSACRIGGGILRLLGRVRYYVRSFFLYYNGNALRRGILFETARFDGGNAVRNRVSCDFVLRYALSLYGLLPYSQNDKTYARLRFGRLARRSCCHYVFVIFPKTLLSFLFFRDTLVSAFSFFCIF